MAVIAAKARLYGMCMIENLRRDEHAKSAGGGNERRAFQEHFWQALVDSLARITLPAMPMTPVSTEVV
jgi:hypothetical protein